MYEKLHNAIRIEDKEKIIFFEHETVDYFKVGFTDSPGSDQYKNRSAMSYHIYCCKDKANLPNGTQLCKECVEDIFNYELEGADRLKVGRIITEFGSVYTSDYEI